MFFDMMTLPTLYSFLKKRRKAMRSTIITAITKEVIPSNTKDLVVLRQLGTNNPKYERLEVVNNMVEYTKGHANEYDILTGEYTPICYQVKVSLKRDNNLLYSLVTFRKNGVLGWQVDKLTADRMTLTSTKYFKLQSLSRIIKSFNGVYTISVYRYDKEQNKLLNKFNALNTDVIKECQRLDRHFVVRMVTDRQDNITTYSN